MLPIFCIAASTLALAGCAVVVAPPAAYSFDPTKPQAKPAADPAQAAAMTQRIAQLQVELVELRSRIAMQPDTWQRLPLYAHENRIHRELGPLQRELSRYASAR